MRKREGEGEREGRGGVEGEGEGEISLKFVRRNPLICDNNYIKLVFP